ncbi:MAG: T9SS type A sorting domain-containing protein, partial [Ginsengibacter sp.]
NLSWAVNAELANDQFEVERSFDQTNFSTSGFVLGAQSVKNGFGQYSFDDKSAEILQHEVIYYRLKQVDIKGNSTYSVVKMVRLPQVSAGKTTVQVMPNPYMDKLKINFESNTNGNAEIRLISASGTVVKKVASAISKGLNSFQIQDLRDQNPGMYVVNIVVNGKSVDSQKIIKN